MVVDEVLDARGLNCPLPILKTKKSLNLLDSGKILEVIATDPNSEEDFKAFCHSTSHELMNFKQDGEEYHFIILCKK
jgi:tRNA 2-thiouridine synthesizing protein A